MNDNDKFTCYECEDEMDSSLIYADYVGDPLCESCYDAHYFTCERCDLVSNWSDRYNVEGSNWCGSCSDYHAIYCDTCDEYHEESCHVYDSSSIKSYDHRPSPIFKWGKNLHNVGSRYGLQSEGKEKTLFIGVELEMENTGSYDSTGDIADWLMNQYGNEENDIYIKHDGSLHDGFEVVSHPRTFNAWRSGIMDDVLKLSERGMVSHNTNTCGLHLSLSRDAFTPSHLYRFSRFVYWNPYFIAKLSRRKPRQLGEWGNPFAYYRNGFQLPADYFRDRDQCELFQNSFGNALYTVKALATNFRNSRGTALNLPRERVEFRSPRGTLKRETFHANIELVQSLYEFTAVNGCRSLYPALFAEYVHNSNRFRNLSNWIDANINSKQMLLMSSHYVNNELNADEYRKGQRLTSLADYSPLNEMIGG